MLKIRSMLSGLVAGLLAISAPAQAQARYPDRPVKLVVPFSAGGQFDMVARMLAQFASGELHQSVIVENVTGSGGNIGAAKVANATPDGYTLLLLGGNHTIAKTLYAKPGFDVAKDFSPVSMVSITPHVVLVNAALPIHSMAELVQYAKKNPGKLSYATPGMGTSMHLTFEMIKSNYGLDILHVPYRGGANALTDLAAGQVNLGIVGIAPAQEFIKAGRVRAIAITSKARSLALPNVPALQEVGYPELNAGSWLGVAGPQGMSADIVARWQAVVRAFQEDPANRKRMEEMGFRVEPNTPAQFQRFILAETETYGKVVRDNKISAD
ncbi:tripartite tricarboxylate transporter substrate binding protein [Hydrogenophaga sp. 2FB]|uniref:Bug family tripartite tricarboxylate transporter substrate binding protein n=1 Tax=Hydrogenophaga sp. 2FB TaxID=2502187 RepID=UPI001484D8CF|nr:tripartite tricarboxylate transporter substrate binding protein [Hydrogenophaga sp. 2FB]